MEEWKKGMVEGWNGGRIRQLKNGRIRPLIAIRATMEEWNVGKILPRTCPTTGGGTEDTEETLRRKSGIVE